MISNVEFNAPSASQSLAYWESRARRFATEGDGLAAVCSYGMPAFYNRSIQLCQRLALAPWLRVSDDCPVLDVGCGVGRWSRVLAARGAQVIGVDISATMVAEATERTVAAGLASRCHFIARDLAELDVTGEFELVLGVTVLQHILDEKRLHAAVRNLAARLAPNGRMVLLEAAPTRLAQRCDSPIFRARSLEWYLDLFDACGLTAKTITGVDPMPLKTWFLPYYARLPKAIAVPLLAALTAAGLPVDALLGRRLVMPSWHKVFVLEHAQPPLG